MITDKKVHTGAKLIIETLKNLGTDTIFGYPGGIVLKLYDELYKQNEIKHVLVRHEQSAVHMAEGYARVSGKCGVVFVTSGPGATNTVTGIVNAYLDGYPLMVITGQVYKNLLGKDAFQEANICDITKSCTKKTFQITDAKDIQNILNEAYYTAMSGKKGPVVVDITKDVFEQETDFQNNSEKNIHINYYSNDDINRIISKITSSSRPIVLSGGGVTHAKAENELYEFSDITNIPVISTMMGLGTFPQDNEKYFGMVGIFGDKSANELLKKSDLIISLGARFNDRISCILESSDYNNKIIQIDINKKEIGQNYTPKDYLVGDIKNVLNDLIKVPKVRITDYSSWFEEIKNIKLINKKNKKTTNLLHTYEIMEALENYTKCKNIIFTTEVGQHQLWAVKNLSFSNKNRKILVSGGSGTMGFGLPAAIGSCIANPSVPVVCITGDGSLQMNLGELALCKDYNLNLKILIINNGYLGMVRQLQQNNCEERYSQTKISNPDFVKIAESYKINACKVTSAGDIIKSLDKAFEKDAPYIIDFTVEPFEIV